MTAACYQVGFLGPAVFLTQLGRVHNTTGAVACMMAAQGLDAFSQSGLYSNHQVLSLQLFLAQKHLYWSWADSSNGLWPTPCHLVQNEAALIGHTYKQGRCKSIGHQSSAPPDRHDNAICLELAQIYCKGVD